MVQFPAARVVKDPNALPAEDERWLLQVLLLDNDKAAVSLAQCVGMPRLGGTWPCWHLPAGLADVDIDKILEPMPSSAYRKLEEAFSTMQVWPLPDEVCVDLGASPGGWTKALRRHGARVSNTRQCVVMPPIICRDRGHVFQLIATNSSRYRAGHSHRSCGAKCGTDEGREGLFRSGGRILLQPSRQKRPGGVRGLDGIRYVDQSEEFGGGGGREGDRSNRRTWGGSLNQRPWEEDSLPCSWWIQNSMYGGSVT
jgi:hypothetical protein